MIQTILRISFPFGFLCIISARISLSGYVKYACKGFLGPVVLLSSVLRKSASAEVTLAPWNSNVRLEVIQQRVVPRQRLAIWSQSASRARTRTENSTTLSAPPSPTTSGNIPLFICIPYISYMEVTLTTLPQGWRGGDREGSGRGRTAHAYGGQAPPGVRRRPGLRREGSPVCAGEAEDTAQRRHQLRGRQVAMDVGAEFFDGRAGFEFVAESENSAMARKLKFLPGFLQISVQQCWSKPPSHYFSSR